MTLAVLLFEMAVHPHVCGERTERNCQICVHPGSSPRVWGARHGDSILTWSTRFIPTCVGSATPPTRKPRSNTVHPHVCGERKSILGNC